jgi:hypothetical protein
MIWVFVGIFGFGTVCDIGEECLRLMSFESTR